MKVRILCNATAEVRELVEDDFDSEEFMWSEGNFSCDCNRYLKFAWIAGEDPSLNAQACGDSAYSVELVDSKTEEVIYSEHAASE